MKNRWWLKLYTIPFLRRISLFWLVLGTCFFFKLYFLNSLFFIALMVVFASRSKISLAANFAFHKHHVSLPELRRGIIEDALFLIGAHLIFAFLTWALTSFNDLVFLGLLVIAGLGVVMVIGSLHQLTFRQGRFNLKDIYKLGPQSNPLIWRGVAVICMMILFAILESLVHALKMDYIYVYSAFAVACLICMIAFVLRIPFHLEPPAGSVLRFLKYSSVGVFGAMALYGMLVLVTAPVVESELDPELRMEALKFRGIFHGPLSVETTVKLYHHTYGDDSFIYAHWPEEMNAFPVENLIKKPSTRELHNYLSSTRPSPRNLLTVSQMLEKLPYSDSDPYRESVQVQLVAKWPQGTPVPESFAKLIKLESERRPANKR